MLKSDCKCKVTCMATDNISKRTKGVGDKERELWTMEATISRFWSEIAIFAGGC